MKRDFDLIIVGAGPVGAALAVALRDSGLGIALLDAHEPPVSASGPEVDLRVFALSPASRRILERLNAWRLIAETRVSPYVEMHVWDATGGGSIHFDCADLGEAALGYIAENRLIQYALWAQLQAVQGVTAIYPAKPEAVAFNANGVTLTLGNGQRLGARLVVAADGAESTMRALVGIETRSASYRQDAIVAHVVTEQPHRDTAWQCFQPTGPIALLPLKDGRSSIVWSLDEACAGEVRQLGDQAFCDAATRASEAILGQITATTPRTAFPLQVMHAREYVRPRFALIGDAAHAIHPLAGQGVNLGFLDMAALAHVIVDACAHARDPGDYSVLRQYPRMRRGDNLAMITALDGFKRLFSNEIVPLQWMRNAGLSAVDRFTPLKNAFMRRAMGLHADLPPLAR